MRFTWRWLGDHFAPHPNTDIAAVIAALPMLGFEVEEVIDHATTLAPFTIARITEVKPHPNASRLQLCTLDIGKQAIEVVCGAPNATPGLVSVFAPVGAYVPGIDLTLKEAKIRGVVSRGMLCSEFELAISPNKAEIISLPATAPIGKPYAQYAGLDDVVIDIAITPNRGDCLGVHGIARDLAAAGLGTLKPLKAKTSPKTANTKSAIQWRVDIPKDKPHLCPYITGRSFSGLSNRQSPDWMQHRLVAVGQRPISALVDITNYIMLDVGRPLHAYDADKIKGDTLTVRLAKAGESLTALNEKTYTLDQDMLVIADGEGADDLAGIMGGERTAISDTTTNMFLEVAIFDPVSVATTGRKLGLLSDARYRFERGLDSTSPDWGLEYATSLVLETCGGTASAITKAGAGVPPMRPVTYRPASCAQLTEVDIPPTRQKQILTNLGFDVAGDTNKSTWQVTPPPWRNDITDKLTGGKNNKNSIVGEADLVEEIMRINGYDAIPQHSLPPITAKHGFTPSQKQASILRRCLAARGMHESVHFTFIDPTAAKHYGTATKHNDSGLDIANPISQDLTVMRPSLLAGLLTATARNQARGQNDVALFEIGPIFTDHTPKGQANRVVGLRVGMTAVHEWTKTSRRIDWLDSKSDAMAGMACLGISPDRLKSETANPPPPYYHPNQCGVITDRQNKTPLAYFGSLHPATLAKADIKGEAASFEIMLDLLPETPTRTHAPLSLSPFQSVVRDFAFIVDATLPAETLLEVVRHAAQPLASEVRLFDVYEAMQTGKGNPAKKSLALSVTVQPTTATLTDAEIDQTTTTIIAAVKKQCGGVLRTS